VANQVRAAGEGRVLTPTLSHKSKQEEEEDDEEEEEEEEVDLFSEYKGATVERQSSRRVSMYSKPSVSKLSRGNTLAR